MRYSIPQFTAIRRILVSNLVSNAEPPASAAPPPRDTVHKPDLRLGFDNRQLATSAYFMSLDGFICAVGWRLYTLPKLLPKLMHNTPA